MIDFAKALDRNDDEKFNLVFPYLFETFKLGIVVSPKRSQVINDLAAILGLSILYNKYYGNPKLSKPALKEFDSWVDDLPDKEDFLEKMILSSNELPEENEQNWMDRFRNRAKRDGVVNDLSEANIRHLSGIVRAMAGSNYSASHLFFVEHILPKIPDFDSKKANSRIYWLDIRLNGY